MSTAADQANSASPFVSTTTPAIELANRLINLRDQPGFLDILRMSQELVDMATATLVDYGGWDPMQIAVLKARAQASKEHHAMLIQKIQDAILGGIAEGRALQAAASEPLKNAKDALEHGDYVRQEVLKTFGDMDDARPCGSY